MTTPWNTIASTALGYFSIACWLVVFAPQIYENYQRKSGESVSLLFLYIWILGDLFGLIGAVQQDLIPTALILYIYYFVADAILLIQIHYYNYIRRRNEAGREASPLLGTEGAQGSVENNGGGQALRASMFLPSLCIMLWWMDSKALHLPFDTRLYSVPQEPKLVPQVLGYISALLFLGARIPQLLKNYYKKSCDGLSIGMFIFSILGNVSFTLSLLLHSLDSDYLLANVPWIVGSTGTLFFDLGIFYQFYLYHH